jgi:DNA-directed RNA polymerase III subunit RPC2
MYGTEFLFCFSICLSEKQVDHVNIQDFDALLQPFYYSKSLTDPINTAKDKWNLLPAFLKVKGLVKQHIDSYNYFVEVQLKKIVQASAEIRSDVDHNFYIRYFPRL